MTTVSSSSIAAILVAFAAYLLFMIVIGAICMRRTNSSEDYFLGGRGLNAWVAALSAQASDMSGWLLMGLPGSIYALGTGQAWIAIGLFLGTVCNWLLISKRLRRYTIVAGNSMTLPEYDRFCTGNVDVSRIADRANHCFCISQWQVCS